MMSPLAGTLRLGLYGAGPHSRGVLLPALTGLDHPLEAVCDPRPHLADDLAERFAFRATFSDLADMLRDANVEALVVSRDAPDLPEIVTKLLSCRLPFWVDAAVAGLDKLMVRLRRRAGKNEPTYMISHPSRSCPSFVRAAELLRSGRLGELGSGSLEICSEKVGTGQGELSLEYLLEGALDLLIFLLGRPSRAYASGDGVSGLAAILHFERVPLVMQLRRAVEPAQAVHLLRLYGQDGQELTVRNLLEMTASQGQSILARGGGSPATITDLGSLQGWTASLASFFSAAAQPGESRPDMTDLLATRKLTEAVIRSAQAGREVQFRA